MRACSPGLGRPGGGEHGERLAAPAPGFGGQAFGGATLVFFLAGVPGGEDALVADDQQGGGEQHQGCQAHEAAPAAADGIGGGVLGGGEAPLGAGAAGGGLPGGLFRGVVVLCGLWGARRRGGGGLAGGAGPGVVPVGGEQREGGGSPRGGGAACGMRTRTGTRGGAGWGRQEHTVMRRVSSGAAGPFSSRVMVPAEK